MKATFIQLPPTDTPFHRLNSVRASEIRGVSVLDENPKNTSWAGPILRITWMYGGSHDVGFHDLDSAMSCAEDILEQLNAL